MRPIYIVLVLVACVPIPNKSAIDTGGSNCTSSDWYLDADGDGYGDPSSTISACEMPPGTVVNDADCNDLDSAINIDAPEICDEVDNDCDDLVDDADDSLDVLTGSTWFVDADSDGYGTIDGPVQACAAPSHHVASSDDCDDTEATVYPGAEEVCDEMDNDCDDVSDEDLLVETWYADVDSDGYGDASVSELSCSQPVGYVKDDMDCDDDDASLHPVAAAGSVVCNDADSLCNGFIRLCATTFEMGCTGGMLSCGTDSTVHTVTLTHDYWVSETEVTRGEFVDTMGYDSVSSSDTATCGDACPETGLTWSEAAAYANELSRDEGFTLCYTCTGVRTGVSCEIETDPYSCTGYRLLTEAEWEGAARCGEDLPYAGSDTVSDVAWYEDNSADEVHAVAGLDPNACGLYDMSGNAAEWTGDWYAPFDAASATDPVGPLSGSTSVLRSGDYTDSSSGCQVADRDYGTPTTSSSRYGFRVTRLVY